MRRTKPLVFNCLEDSRVLDNRVEPEDGGRLSTMRVAKLLGGTDKQDLWHWPNLKCKVKGDELCTLKIPKPNHSPFSSRANLIYLWRLLRAWRQLKHYDILLLDQVTHAVLLYCAMCKFGRRQKPKIVILEFQTSDFANSLRDKAKLAFSRHILSCVPRISCASRRETLYHKQLFGWSDEKIRFMPLYSSRRPSEALKMHPVGRIVFSGGRSGRDYKTFLTAVKGLPVEFAIVASPGNLQGLDIPSNVRVRYDIPRIDFNMMITESKFIVLPLKDQVKSVGQRVLLKAMETGKAVIASQTAGMKDYIVDGETGFLVPPDDPDSLRERIQYLLDNPEQVTKLGNAALNSVRENYCSERYIGRVYELLNELRCDIQMQEQM